MYFSKVVKKMSEKNSMNSKLNTIIQALADLQQIVSDLTDAVQEQEDERNEIGKSIEKVRSEIRKTISIGLRAVAQENLRMESMKKKPTGSILAEDVEIGYSEAGRESGAATGLYAKGKRGVTDIGTQPEHQLWLGSIESGLTAEGAGYRPQRSKRLRLTEKAYKKSMESTVDSFLADIASGKIKRREIDEYFRRRFRGQ